MKKLISHQLSPNLFLGDFFRGFIGLLTPQKFRKNLVFATYFQTKDYLLLDSARSALTLIAEHLEKSFPPSPTIAIPSFCCAVMATPFISRGWHIHWIDTNPNGQFTHIELEKILTNKNPQTFHTLLLPQIFGQEVKWEKIQSLCKKHQITLIQDLAHSFSPAKSQKFGDYQIYSFGREKTISCVSGGALTCNNPHDFQAIQQSFQQPHSDADLSRRNRKSGIKELLQILTYTLSLPWYYQGGKIIPILIQKLKLLPLAVTPAEKSASQNYSPTPLPYSLQKILHHQCENFSTTFSHREKLAHTWQKTLKNLSQKNTITSITPPNYFRLILNFQDKNLRDKIYEISQKHGYLFREWDGIPISPQDVNLEKFHYKKGQCPQAEHFTTHYLTLPINARITEKDIKNWEKIITPLLN